MNHLPSAYCSAAAFAEIDPLEPGVASMLPAQAMPEFDDACAAHSLHELKSMQEALQDFAEYMIY